MRLRDNTAGFTIVEALVALTVTTIVVLVITNFMLTNLQESTLATNRSTLIKETQQSLDLAARDIRLSANADDNNRWTDTNAPGGDFGWQSDGDTLVLATAVENTSGNVVFDDAVNYVTTKNNIVYFVQNGTLYKRTIAAPVSGNSLKTSCPAASASNSCPADKELLSNISDFDVIYKDGQNNTVDPTDARSIELHVTVSKKVFGKTLTADYTTRMVFRND